MNTSESSNARTRVHIMRIRPTATVTTVFFLLGCVVVSGCLSLGGGEITVELLDETGNVIHKNRGPGGVPIDGHVFSTRSSDGSFEWTGLTDSKESELHFRWIDVRVGGDVIGRFFDINIIRDGGCVADKVRWTIDKDSEQRMRRLTRTDR